MKISRRYQLRLREPLSSELEAFARAHDLDRCAAIRLLIRQGLDRQEERQGGAVESPVALAALIAAEHTLLVVASILPEGRSLIDSLGAKAMVAAEQRLALVETAEPDARTTP